MSTAIRPPVVMTIAGSDSGGGAGIQADLKTFTALGVFGTTAITSITSQNTLGVHAVRDLPPDTVYSQIVAIMDDLRPDAVKSGMLSNAAIVTAVADALEKYGVSNYVLDPVMVSETGHGLLQSDAVDVLIERLLPLALIVTPNRYEAEALTQSTIRDEKEMANAAAQILALGPRYVLIKGGHMPGDEAVDLLVGDGRVERFAAPRVATRNTHGTGCTYAAAVAANLAKGLALRDSVAAAKAYVSGAIVHGFSLGAGAGPLNHFWQS